MDFASICRTCLNTDALNPIFVNPGAEKRYLAAIFVTTGIKISPDDGLPQKLCNACINYLNNSLMFRKKCRDSEKLLLQYKNQFETDGSIRFTLKTKVSSINKTYSKKEENGNSLKQQNVLLLSNFKDLGVQQCPRQVEQRHKVVIKYISKANTTPTVDKNEQNEKLMKYEVSEDFDDDDDDDDKPLKYLVANDSENFTPKSEPLNLDLQYTEKVPAIDFIEDEKLTPKLEPSRLDLQSSEKMPYEIDIADPKQNRVVCKVCRKSLSLRSIDKHMASAHPGKDCRKVQCDLCDNFVLKEMYSRHMSLMHGARYEQAEMNKCFRCSVSHWAGPDK